MNKFGTVQLYKIVIGRSCILLGKTCVMAHIATDQDMPTDMDMRTTVPGFFVIKKDTTKRVPGTHPTDHPQKDRMSFVLTIILQFH